jgi:hypothetical protein
MISFVLLVTACGSSGGDEGTTVDQGTATDQGGQGTETTAASNDGSQSGNEVPSSGNDGSVEYQFGGNWEGSGELVFYPQASVFQDDVWTLTFVKDVDQTTGALFTIRVSTVDGYISYADEEVGTTGTLDQCTFDIGKSDIDGTSGSFECNDLNMVVINGSGRDGVTFTGTWESRG